ncbi:MAG TPA: M1 family metallopeptidase [Gemmatimonadaceae bacterium]|nr:M1 family metallopeptidase [Gemmatimonadaceae bacterium]
MFSRNVFTPAARASRHVAVALAAAIVAALAAPSLGAQSLYVPRTMKKAYANGTRALDGNVGPRYWQNSGRYKITITTLPPDRRVSGTEEITYRNESPDTLRMLVIKLFPNYHKPGAPRDGGARPDFLTSGVHIRSFAVNGTPQKWNDNPRFFTWQPVRLPSALAPKDSVHLAFRWWYDLSRQPGREGEIDSTTFFVAYFYPRVAVYDDYNGWDMMDHAGHEFYSDFNDYDVTVNVPANYVVWGTGTLTNAADVLQPEALSRFKASFTSDSTIHVATGTQTHDGAITTAHAMNSWHFTAADVPDVAFGLSDHYDWDAASVLVDNATHRRAGVQAAYNDSASDFHQMVQFARHALDFLSHQWPGVPYPYEKTTEFQGGAGMEYPMVANDQSYPSKAFAAFVAAHEIAHTYMPFYMGTNETRYAFMDEGWATTFEYLISRVDVGVDSASAQFERFRIDRWARNPSPDQDLPIVTPADALTGGAYGINAYGKPALGYLAVKDLLGDALFAKCLHAYMTRWHGRHPTPWDFFRTFDDVSGRSLDWFWSNWFFSNGYIDLAVKNVTKSGGALAVTVANVGGLAAPFDIVVRYHDGSTNRVHESSAAWSRDAKLATEKVRVRKDVKSIDIDGGIWVDADTSNNIWTAR